MKYSFTRRQPSPQATQDLLHTLRSGSPSEASEQVVQLLQEGVAVQSIYDALFAGAGELLMRQRGIVSLHAVTTTNAIHHAFTAASDESTRQYLLLQNAAFLPMFRAHGTDAPREIWRFGEPGEAMFEALKKFLELRYRAN